MESRYGIVYKITNLVNNKVYIGITKRSFKRVYGEESMRNIIKLTNNDRLKNDIVKYGEDAFEIIPELDVAFSEDELKEKKIYYINKFDSYENGYNMRFIRGFDSNENHPLYTPIVLVNTMEVFHTLKDASDKYGVLPQNIYACCNNRQRSAGKDKNGNKLLWRYANELDVVLEQEERETYINSQINGEFIYCVNTGEVFCNAIEVAKRYKLLTSKLYNHLNGKTSSCGEKNGKKLCFVTEYKYLSMTEYDKEVAIIKAEIDYHLKHSWVIHIKTKNIYKSKVQLAKLLNISRPTLDTRFKTGEFMTLKEYEKIYSPINNVWDFLTTDVQDINIVKTKKLKYRYICLNTKEKFYRLQDIKDKYEKISTRCVTLCCKKRLKSAGRHPVTNKKLVWMYYDEYKELNLKEEG